MRRAVLVGIAVSTLFSLSLVKSEEENQDDSKSIFHRELSAQRECLRVVDDTLKSFQNKNQNEISLTANIHPDGNANGSVESFVETVKYLSAKVEEFDSAIKTIQTAINKLKRSKNSFQTPEGESDDWTGTVSYSNSSKKLVEGFILATEEGVVTVTLPAFHRTQISNFRTYLVAFDWSIQKVYWLDTRGIKRANLDGTDAEIFLKQIPMGLAVDSITGNVYYTSPATREIRVCSRDGGKCSVLVAEQKGITTLAVCSFKRLMFWTNNDIEIVRANLDGTNATVLVPGFLRGVDESSERLYFDQRRERNLASCDFNGKDSKIVLYNADRLSGVAFYEDVVYFGNGTDEKLRSICKNGGDPLIATRTTATINGITSYGQAQEKNFAFNPCASSPCSHLCVLKLESFACLCPEGMRLKQDGTTCVDIPESRE